MHDGPILKVLHPALATVSVHDAAAFVAWLYKPEDGGTVDPMTWFNRNARSGRTG